MRTAEGADVGAGWLSSMRKLPIARRAASSRPRTLMSTSLSYDEFRHLNGLLAGRFQELEKL
jgi:hypothetical protein